MRERDYYPAGAYDDPNAPYNQVEPPEVEIDIYASFTVERCCTILTDNVYHDEDGWWLCDDASLDDEYSKNYDGIPKLLEELVKYIDGELQGDISHKRREELIKMRESATGWDVVECNHEKV